MIIAICVPIFTLFFVILVVYLIMTLTALQQTIKNVNDIMTKSEIKEETVNDEALKLLQRSNNITETINDQLKAFNPFVKSVSSAGMVIQKTMDFLNEDLNGIKPASKEFRAGWQENMLDLLEL